MPAREHRDVDEVHGDAEDANQQAQVTVDTGVPFVERMKRVRLERFAHLASGFGFSLSNEASY